MHAEIAALKRPGTALEQKAGSRNRARAGMVLSASPTACACDRRPCTGSKYGTLSSEQPAQYWKN
jgi:hypothetical protein